MDHILELPEDPAFGPIAIPYISGGVYDNQGFHDFPTRKGFAYLDLQLGETRGHSVTDVRRFLQGWLFFGVLSEFLGTTLDPLDFVCDDESADGESRLSTKPLGKRLARWRDRMELTDTDEKKEVVFRILSCLEIVGEATRSDIMSNLMGPELHLAVSVLGSTLDKARLSLRMRVAEADLKFCSRGQKHNDDYVLFGANVLLIDRMLTSGWCPNQVGRAGRDLTPSGMYFASMLKHPTPTNDHKACTRNRCKMNQIDEATYKTKHVQSGCDCCFIGPNMAEIAKVLESGDIPVIAIKTSLTGGGCRLRVVPFRPDHSGSNPFIAISHVWGDGMGNVNENALPDCQIRRLKSLVEAIYNKISDCCNNSLQSRAERLGDVNVSLDDSLFNAKLEGVPAILSRILNSEIPREEELSRLSGQELQDMLLKDAWNVAKEEMKSSAYLKFYGNMAQAYEIEQRSHRIKRESAYVESETLMDNSHIDNAEISGPTKGDNFYWLVNDAWNRDFMPHHGSSGDFNFEWKLYDSKSLWEAERYLRDVNMSEEVLIWLDTLCVPLDKRLRTMAIRRMKETYAYAEKVLVLDTQIQATSGAQSYEESLMRINLSSWMQRAWTLEEAAVGGILLFQFKDGVFDLWRYGRSWLRRATRSIVLSDVSQAWCALRRIQGPRHHIEQMQRAYDALENRTTSKRPDINLIFSFLMGVNPHAFLAPKEDRDPRAQIFFDLQGTFPTGLLWVSSKNKEENYQPVALTQMDMLETSIQAAKDPRSS